MSSYARVRPSVIVEGALGGHLTLATPWARQAIPEADRQGIADRVPARHTLYVSARASKFDWSVRLYSLDANPTEPVIELLHQRGARRGVEAVLRLVIRDIRCWYCERLVDDDWRWVGNEWRTVRICDHCWQKADVEPPLDYTEDEE